MCWKLVYLPFVGEYLVPQNNNENDKVDIETIDAYEIIGLAKRLNITLADMKEMSFVSLFNILYKAVAEKENNATQQDIDNLLR